MNKSVYNLAASTGIGLEELYGRCPVGHVVFKFDGSILFCSNTLCSWLELPADEDIPGKNFFNILPKSGKLYFQMFVLPLLEMQSKVSEISLEVETSSKVKFSCLLYANTIVENNESYVYASLIKISDRKKFEAQLIREKQIADEGKKRLEFLANSVSNLLFTVGQNGTISFANERFYEYFNFTTDDLEQAFLQRLVHPQDFDLVANNWSASFYGLKPLNIEARLVNAQGSYEWFIIDIVPYLDETGKAVVWFGSCTNINQQKEKQQRLVNNLNQNLSVASETIAKNEKSFREIAFYQSHVVRLPLVNILGITQLLAEMEISDECKELFDLLIESTQQLDDTIQKIVSETYTAE